MVNIRSICESQFQTNFQICLRLLLTETITIRNRSRETSQGGINMEVQSAKRCDANALFANGLMFKV